MEGGAGIPPPPPPPPPRNLEIEYGYYCFVTGIKQQSCSRLRQKQSERIDLNSTFSWGAFPQIPVVGTHTYVCVSVLSRATIILLPPCFTPPNSKSCMKPWVCSSLIIKTTPLFALLQRELSSCHGAVRQGYPVL